ncbi:MAG: SPOR domain-containing protein [Bacteroidia bacterium]|nr:SPOR domain-containing protein [Bacteroidia bacterium]MCC6769450.1 SPOR domain-containing protein [Bacteroidia bacterium]
MDTGSFDNRKSLIAREIHTLLWSHNCVIIPGFGGLIGNYSPGNSHPVSHEFNPPSKQIAFNKHLHRDDGLLVQNLAARLQLDFNATRTWLDETVNTIRERLQAGEGFKLKEVGVFRLDVEKNIQFYPETHQQFLPQAYGLYAFRAVPVQRFQRTIPQPEIQVLAPVPVKRLFPGKTLRKKLLRLSPLLLLALLPLFKDQVSFEDASTKLKVNPFPTEKAMVQVMPVKTYFEPVLRKAILAEPSGFSAASARIFIVAGCYSNDETALGRVEYLKAKGFDAAVLDLTPAGLYRVVYGGYDDIELAKSEMEKITKGLNEDAWLLIR